MRVLRLPRGVAQFLASRGASDVLEGTKERLKLISWDAIVPDGDPSIHQVRVMAFYIDGNLRRRLPNGDPRKRLPELSS